MKINTQTHDVAANGMMNQRKFTVDAGAHIMAVLSGLYKNPVDAMVREYLTNMYDAYVALERQRPGSTVVPPVLHLPTALDGNLTFRDNGIGMSLETVWNVYATYGASTKNGNNDEVGGFGLGSKTAFCYNGGASWTIESRYDGEKHIFMAFIGEDGVPNLSHVTTMPTNEHNGLTISIPIRREDHRAAYEAANRYVPYFPMPLRVEGDTISPVHYIVRGQTWGLRKAHDNRGYRNSDLKVIMGNVPYTVDVIETRVLHHGRDYDLRDFLYYNGIDLWVNIGDVDIVPSRDDLKYTDRTKAAIKSALDRMFAEVGVEIGKRLDACETEWDAISTFNRTNDISNIHAVVKTLTWRGKNIVVNTVSAKRKHFMALDPSFTITRYAITSSDRAGIEVTENPDTVEMSPIHDNMFFVLDDLAKGGVMVARALAYQKLVHKTGNGRTARYGHKIGHVYLVKTTLTPDRIGKLLGGMPASNIQLASVLKGVVPMHQAAKLTKDTIYRWSGTSWDARVNIPTGTKFYYLPLNKDSYTGRWSFTNNRYGAQKDAIMTIRKAAESLGIKYDVIYGIKSDDVKNFDASWINLVEAMEAEATKTITNNPETFALATKISYNGQWRNVHMALTSSDLSKTVDEARQFVSEFEKIEKARGSHMVAVVNSLRDRIPTLDTTLVTVTKSITLPTPDKTLDTLYTKYPMVKIIINLCASSYYGNERYELLKKNKSALLAYAAQNA